MESHEIEMLLDSSEFEKKLEEIGISYSRSSSLSFSLSEVDMEAIDSLIENTQQELAKASVGELLLEEDKALAVLDPSQKKESEIGAGRPDSQTKKNTEYIGISLQQQNKQIYNKIEQVVDLMCFKSSKLNDPNEYCSAKEKSPLIASLFKKPIRDFLMSSNFLDKWWNVGYTRERAICARYDATGKTTFFRDIKTNGTIINNLLNSEEQYKLLDANLMDYWGGLGCLAYAARQEMDKKEHCYAKGAF
ncbi:MAG: hypothetical protein V4471_02065 [Pseudomonadota bacterium]